MPNTTSADGGQSEASKVKNDTSRATAIPVAAHLIHRIRDGVTLPD